jgi:hypothetical protein
VGYNVEAGIDDIEAIHKVIGNQAFHKDIPHALGQVETEPGGGGGAVWKGDKDVAGYDALGLEGRVELRDLAIRGFDSEAWRW